MRLHFDIGHPGLTELNFTLEKLDFSIFEFSCRDDDTKPTIPLEDCTFRDIFNFVDNLFYSEPGYCGDVFPMGSVVVYSKKNGDIYLYYCGQLRIRPFDNDLNPNPYGLDVDEFDLDSGNSFISIKSPGGFFCYQLSGDPFVQIGEIR